jgi:hypothetical protein
MEALFRKHYPDVEVNGWGSAGGSLIHVNSFLRVYYSLQTFDFSKIRETTWIDAFKHDDTTLAILFALCGLPYRIWKDNPEIGEASQLGAFLHGYKECYDYKRGGKSLEEHQKKVRQEEDEIYQQYKNKK